jgi:D-alanyl-D-alanine carboxypeptidase
LRTIALALAHVLIARSDALPAPSARSPSTAAASAASGGLAWVDPARCLPVCAGAPTSTLRRLDDTANPSARGKHRVEPETAEALGTLLAGARAAGFRIRINSAFRPYREQARVFRTTKERGRAARPGHSEHQLGTAVDLRLPSTAGIEWLAAHAYEYGFVLSYPLGKQRLTGYRPEPWHVRFVGRELAVELHQQGRTLAEHFRALPALGRFGDCADCPLAASRAPCDRIDDRGKCQGTVLSWCYDGMLATVDCAASDQTCDESGETPDCR